MVYSTMLRFFPSFGTRRPLHLLVGCQGERVAAAYLRSLGYQILGRNVHIGKHLELDLVAMDPRDHVTVFAEVKTRSAPKSPYPPEINLTKTKRRILQRAARGWMATFGQTQAYRLDFIGVSNGTVSHHIQDLAWKTFSEKRRYS